MKHTTQHPAAAEAAHAAQQGTGPSGQEAAPGIVDDLRLIAQTLREQMPPEAAAQLVLEVSEAIEADAQATGSSFKALPPYDKLCLACRESYIKGFVDACRLAALPISGKQGETP